MATQQQIDDMLTSIGAANDLMAKLSAERAKLQGYRENKQTYIQAVQDQQVVVQGLVDSSQAVLTDLKNKIATVFP